MVIGQGVPFLLALETIVHEDPAPTGFSGDLCFGVHQKDGTVWWWASFGEEVRTGFCETFAEDAQAILVLSERQAAAIVRSGCLPAGEVPHVRGDRALLRRFLDRYATPRTWISVRTTTPQGRQQ